MTDTAGWRIGSAAVDEHPWVLVVTAGTDDLDMLASVVRDRGCEVFVCSNACPGHSCPLIDGGACPVIDQAHLVVDDLTSADARADALRAMLADRHPDLPVIDVTEFPEWAG